MSAFSRRTQFATPVIIAVASCSSKEPPEQNEKRFPGVTWNVRMIEMKCRATEPGPNPPPPRAIECPPGMAGNTIFTVGELANKSCAIVPAGCFEESCVKLPTPCPLPPGKEVAQALLVVTVEKRGDKCHAEEGEGHADCPPGVDCNPPQPRIVQCPPGVTEEKSLRIGELPDGTCVIVPDGCKDTSCATQKTECLK